MLLPVHTGDNTNERSCSGKDVLNFSFLIGNFWPVALNKTHIVCTRMQAQLPEPSCIKDLIGCGFTTVRLFPIKLFHSWVFRQLRHECSPLSQSPDDLSFSTERRLQSAYPTSTGTSFLEAFQSCLLMKLGARRRRNASCFDCPGRISTAPV